MSENLCPRLTYYPMRQVLTVKKPQMHMFTCRLADGLGIEYFKIELGQEAYTDRVREKRAVGLNKLSLLFTAACSADRLRCATEQRRAAMLTACQRAGNVKGSM